MSFLARACADRFILGPCIQFSKTYCKRRQTNILVILVTKPLGYFSLKLHGIVPAVRGLTAVDQLEGPAFGRRAFGRNLIYGLPHLATSVKDIFARSAFNFDRAFEIRTLTFSLS